MEKGRVTSRQIVTEYFVRIGMYEDMLHAALRVNRAALEEADDRDRERAQGRVRGPLHGIPIALKDNILTTHLPTTGGALVFDGFVPPYEATITANLRTAGAIIIAKTGMTELANWVAVGMPGNYNAIGGFGMNPYDPRRDPRGGSGDGGPVMSPGGSSSGIGTAANLWAANVGSETSGSILTPANVTMLAAVKPTVGRISRYGMIPITADQDTAGPMARNVMDAATLLGVLEGAAPDPHDAATRRCTPPPGRDYTRLLRVDALKGARIGLPRASYESAGAGAARLLTDAIATLTALGAVIVDPAEIPSVIDPDRKNNFLLGGRVRAPTNAAVGTSTARCSQVRHETRFQHVAGVSGTLGAGENTVGAHCVELGAQGRGRHSVRADAARDFRRNGCRAGPRALRARPREGHALSATHGIDEVMNAKQLDALLFPGASGAPLPPRLAIPLSCPWGLSHSPRSPYHLALRPSLALRRCLHRHGLQRATADRVRVRVRTGHEEARATVHAVIRGSPPRARPSSSIGAPLGVSLSCGRSSGPDRRSRQGARRDQEAGADAATRSSCSTTTTRRWSSSSRCSRRCSRSRRPRRTAS